MAISKICSTCNVHLWRTCQYLVGKLPHTLLWSLIMLNWVEGCVNPSDVRYLEVQQDVRISLSFYYHSCMHWEISMIKLYSWCKRNTKKNGAVSIHVRSTCQTSIHKARSSITLHAHNMIKAQRFHNFLRLFTTTRSSSWTHLVFMHDRRDAAIFFNTTIRKHD